VRTAPTLLTQATQPAIDRVKPRKTVKSILQSFVKTADELDALVSRERSEAEKATAEIANLTAKRLASEDEAKRAALAADNIRKLIGEAA
jgi:hypothetical protein